MVRAICQERTITAEVTGTDRYKYFRRPVTEAKDGSPSGTTTRFPLLGLENVTSLGLLAPPTTAQKPPTRHAATQVRATQTDYRESEAQTRPWTPPYTTHGDSTPEVLYLDRLSWGDGLPPGRHEVDIVERLRRKRAWESRLPPPDCQENINIRYKLIAEMERSDWKFREQEIEAVQEQRMKKSEQLLEKHTLMNRSRLNCRMEFLNDDFNKRKEQKLQLIRHDKERALRKLCMREKGYDPKKSKMSVLEEHLRHSSELYAPMKRYGVSFKNRNEKLAQKDFTIDDGDVCDFVYAPSFRPAFDFNKASQPKRQTELCVRETRWTMENLVKLHQDLQKLRANSSSKMDAFYAQIEHRPKPSVRAEVSTLPCAKRMLGEESLYQAAIVIQRVVHSRSMQTLMEQKRDCWKELMQELKISRNGRSVQNISNYRHDHILQARMTGVLDNLIGLNVGTSIGQTLYLLATELLRFKNEGIAHSQAMQAEAARWRRELPEEGRRQRELRRREEHNLMFAQLLEVYQDSINGFLEGLLSEARENEAKLQAYEHAKEVARLAELERLNRPPTPPEEPVSADLLFQLIAPEGLQQLARTCLLILKQKYQEARKCLAERGQAEMSDSRKPSEVSVKSEHVMEQTTYPGEKMSPVLSREHGQAEMSDSRKLSEVSGRSEHVMEQTTYPGEKMSPVSSREHGQAEMSDSRKPSEMSEGSEYVIKQTTYPGGEVSPVLSREHGQAEMSDSRKPSKVSDRLEQVMEQTTYPGVEMSPALSSIRLVDQFSSKELTNLVDSESTETSEYSPLQEPKMLILFDGMEPMELMGPVSVDSSTAPLGSSLEYSEVSDMVSNLMAEAGLPAISPCRKFDLRGEVDAANVEERLLTRVMRDMCFVAGSLLHTAANILNKAIQLAGIPQESFDEALRRTMQVINGALREVISLILPKKPEEKQPVSEELIIEASKIVDEILQKAKQRIAEMKEEEMLKVSSNDAESRAKKLVEDVINEAQQRILGMIVEDFLEDLFQEVIDKVNTVNEG